MNELPSDISEFEASLTAFRDQPSDSFRADTLSTIRQELTISTQKKQWQTFAAVAATILILFRLGVITATPTQHSQNNLFEEQSARTFELHEILPDMPQEEAVKFLHVAVRPR